VEQNTHLAEEETIADIFDVRVVAFDACIYNVCGRLYERAFDYFFSQKEPYLAETPRILSFRVVLGKKLWKTFWLLVFLFGSVFLAPTKHEEEDYEEEEEEEEEGRGGKKYVHGEFCSRDARVVGWIGNAR
jgi:hypothetical protein